LRYLDTGAMYRGVTYALQREGLDPENEESAARIAAGISLELKEEEGGSALYIDGVNVEREIRSSEVSRFVSPVSRHRSVRREMVKIQRSIARDGGIVAEGRDTGSVVFPFAHIKVFLVADTEARVRRRQKQLESMGLSESIDDIRENINRRDTIDSNREHSPLIRPPGSILVDTSDLTIDRQVETIERAVLDAARKLASLRVWPGERNDSEHITLHFRVTLFIVRVLCKLIFGLRIYGQDNLRYREHFIFASNHISNADPPIVSCGLKREVYFLAKKELFRNRFFGWLIRSYNSIPIARDEIDMRTMKLILSRLKSGKSVLMFPEGTRSKTGEIGSLKGGIGFLSLNTGVTIVPVFVRGTNKLMDCLLRRKRLELNIGPPIRLPAGYEPENKKLDYRLLNQMVFEELRMLKDEWEA
ncbi:MAG: (d)CMP kinase, partial [Candidatus Krumholzibacteria bacterium]|nr:(d)CMP kinase [Candidatus Krumholzibacteria bacterium]